MNSALVFPDSNIFSEIIRQVPNAKVSQKYYDNLNKMGVAITVWHELLYGINNMPKGKRHNMVADYIKNDVGSLQKYFYTVQCTEIHAKIRADARKTGKTLAFADSQIASIALVHDAVLVTRNVNDFSGIDGLQIENWFEAHHQAFFLNLCSSYFLKR